MTPDQKHKNPNPPTNQPTNQPQIPKISINAVSTIKDNVHILYDYRYRGGKSQYPIYVTDK